MKNNFTLIIPTHNRHHYLKRILKFYIKSDFNILIFDSSSKKMESILIKRKNIKYFHCPTFSFTDKFINSIKKVKSEYVAFCADDDFIFPKAIKKCCKFLDNNHDYVAAQGKLLSFIHFDDTKTIEYSYKTYADLIKTNYLENDDTIKRVKKFSSPYRHTIYAVHRTNNLNNIYNQMEKHNIKESYLCEFTQAILTVLSGKIIELNKLYHLRELIVNSTGRTDKTIKELHDMNHPEIQSVKLLIQNKLIDEYNLKIKNANLITDKIFKNFDSFVKEWNHTVNKRVLLTTLSNESVIKYDKEILRNFYKNEPLIQKTEKLISESDITSGFKENEFYENKLRENIIVFYNAIETLYNRISKDNKRIVLYGAGTICKLFLKINKNLKIQFIVDKNTNLHNTTLYDIPIKSPQALIEKIGTYDLIIITSIGYEKIIINFLEKELQLKKSILKIIQN